MKIKTIISIIISTIILASCQNDSETIDAEFGGIEDELIESLSGIGSKKETFEINPQKPNTIVCKNGTVLIIRLVLP